MKVIKLLQAIIAYIILTIAIVAFIPAIILYALSVYIDDPKTANQTIQLIIKYLKDKDVK